jgi:hypothetical protein
MIVRLRFNEGAPKRLPPAAPHVVAMAAAGRPASPGAASGLAAILTPAAVLFVAFAMWRIGADLGLAHEFLVSDGVLSRWQVWFAGAVVLQAGAFFLNRRVEAQQAEPESVPPAAQFPSDRYPRF